jgi:hypothetical protein
MTQFSSLYGRLLGQELGTDDSTQLFTDARRKAAVNDGIAEFADLTECYVSVSTIVWTGGTLEVDLNSTVIPNQDFVRLAAKQSPEVLYTDASSRVTQVSGDDLRQVDVAWLNRAQPAWRFSTVASSVMQLPARFYLRPDHGALYFGLVPVLSTGSSASAKVLIPYVAKPPVLTADTSEPFTDSGNVRLDLRPWHRAAVHYAAHQMEKLRRDDQASDRQLQRFLAYVQCGDRRVRAVLGKRVSWGPGRCPRRPCAARAPVTKRSVRNGGSICAPRICAPRPS